MIWTVCVYLPFSDVCNDFSVKTMLGLYLLRFVWVPVLLWYLYLSTYTHVQHDLNIRWCSCCWTVTSRCHLWSSRAHSWFFLLGLCCSILIFCVVFCRSLFVFLSLFFWPYPWKCLIWLPLLSFIDLWLQIYSSRWTSVFRPKTNTTLFGPVNISVLFKTI